MITGLILPIEWDNNGKVIEVAIYTEEEEIFLVGHNERIKDCLSSIQKKVQVEGQIARKSKGYNRIYITFFKIISNNNEPSSCPVIKGKENLS